MQRDEAEQDQVMVQTHSRGVRARQSLQEVGLEAKVRHLQRPRSGVYRGQGPVST